MAGFAEAPEARNEKIIRGIIRRAERVCPGSLALIGIYGSFSTGRIHPGSDLDLLILINDEGGYRLKAAFVQEDLGIGHDLYCTRWEDLERMAEYPDPHISKLMDSRIVYVSAPEYAERLQALRSRVAELLDAPFSRADYDKAENMFREGLTCLALAETAETLPEVRRRAGGALYCTEAAIAMLNKRYFRLGTKDIMEELAAMPRRPEDLPGLLDGVVSAGNPEEVRRRLARLMEETAAVFREAERSLPEGERPVPPEALRGTWEEMVSNWRGKLHLAARTGDRHLAFTSLESFDAMLADVAEGALKGKYDALAIYDLADLAATAARFDKLLEDYLTEYRRAGLEPVRYGDIDAFLRRYLDEE
ncbi:MAG: nucleotidyltransferase domain-containing protein [Oscillospiraceae bacterium]|nr:nucleotidyltransferase domain-containing protein [Oscillospiraceae bacterium]